VTLPATGRQLRRLEERGLVVLEPDPRDRRVTRARLTDAGAAARASIMADRRARISEAVGGLRSDRRTTSRIETIASALEITRPPARAAGREGRKSGQVD